MGIYDRDYYRDGSSGFHPFDSRIQACVALVCIYVAVFIVQIGTREPALNRILRPGPVTEALVLKPSKVLEGEVWRVVTYAFAHDPFLIAPIVVNIVFLIWIGHSIEDIYGWKEFLAYYLFAGFLAGGVFVGLAVLSNHDGILLGPSASVTAVLFLFALHYPTRMVFGYVPIWFVVAFYVLNDTLGLLGGHRHPAAFASHAVAVLFALLYYQYSLRVSNWLPSWPTRGVRKQRSRSKLHIYRDEPADEPVPSAPATAPSVPSAKPGTATAPANGTATHSDMDEHLEAKLDEILEKVKKHGQDSLTEEERAVLFRASEIYRQRRK